MELDAVTRDFVLHWGEMGSRWGINRTVAQIHALLFISPQPLHAEQIAGTLSIARSNVSTSLRELQGWGIVKVVHVLGDRRDHFESMKDVWEMFRIIVRERKRREVDPTLEVLERCVEQAKGKNGPGEHVRGQLSKMREFFADARDWYDHVDRLNTRDLTRFIKLGNKIGKLVGAKAR